MPVKDSKDIEFYAATVNAWFNTRLEHDKSLLALSSGGVALLITLLTANGISSAEGLTLNILAIISFVISILSVLLIFKFNGDHLVQLINDPAVIESKLLKKLDQITQVSFACGVIFTSIIGISAAVDAYSIRKINMSNPNGKITQGIAQDSFNGIAKLQNQATTNTIQKSFTGAAALKPTNESNTGSTNTVPVNATPSK
jgi:hypothetical protein